MFRRRRNHVPNPMIGTPVKASTRPAGAGAAKLVVKEALNNVLL
jgi:hypothetical protein